MTELLAPAGDFECAKIALYNGADAIYCACSRFGARAYAKNLSIDELKRLLILAHSLKKKIYVTVNTILKDDELKDCIEFVNELYTIGVDGLILADFAIINYVINNLPKMEAHISTQCGVKNLNDVKFFEDLGAKRVVLARESTYDEIKLIKENSSMPLEVFAHGALCVSYSGGCLMSSLLTQRSGNRGRCSQNCRREYTILKDDKIIGEKASWLSMKDLNTFSNLNKLVEIGVDSLKLEGRMKNPDYVKIITEEYRKKIDSTNYKSDNLDKVFHRTYTKGFVFGEDHGTIVDSSKRSREGDFIGYTSKNIDGLTECEITKSLNVGDRIRIEGEPDFFCSISSILDKSKKPVTNGTGIVFLTLSKKFNSKAKIYKMVDSSIALEITDQFKTPLVFEVYGSYNTPLTIKTTLFGKTYTASSNALFDLASSKPIDTSTLNKQLSKLKDTSFYLSKLNNNLNGDLFMTISSINETRRILIESIESDMQGNRTIDKISDKIEPINYELEPLELTAFCVNEDQYEALKELGIKHIYYKNYSPYVNSKFNDVSDEEILVGNYGGITAYSTHTLVSDYSFNVINAKAIYDLHRMNVKYVTLSLEASLDDMRNIKSEYQKYGNNPNLEIIVYGRENLMTTKYCPLRGLGECGSCNNHKYDLKDDFAKFPIYHSGCITHIVNEKPLNLIDDLKEITKYSNRLRLSFTTETKEEIYSIVKMFKSRLNNLDDTSKLFDSKNNTRGHFHRSIL